MLSFKTSIASAILTFVLFTGGMQFESADLAYGQAPEVNFTEDSVSPIDEVLQYCRLVNDYGANDGKEDITGDLVDTGKVGTMYEGWTCDDAKELDERMNRIGDTLKDLEALNEMDK